MYLKKLRRGVLHVETSQGLRCVELTKRERIKLLWLFRNFTILPEAVLGRAARNLLQALLSNDRSQLRCANNHAADDDFVIGTVECVAAKKPVVSAAKLPSPAALVPDAPGLSRRAVS